MWCKFKWSFLMTSPIHLIIRECSAHSLFSQINWYVETGSAVSFPCIYIVIPSTQYSHHVNNLVLSRRHLLLHPLNCDFIFQLTRLYGVSSCVYHISVMCNVYRKVSLILLNVELDSARYSGRSPWELVDIKHCLPIY